MSAFKTFLVPNSLSQDNIVLVHDRVYGVVFCPFHVHSTRKLASNDSQLKEV